MEELQIRLRELLGNEEARYFYHFTSVDANIILEEGLKTIEVQAFNSCTSLKDLVFPSSLETVKNNAFQGAYATVIVFTKPSNLKTVQSAAFNSIGSCEKLYYGYKNSPDDWKSINIEKTFANLDDGFTNTNVFIPY